MDGLQTILAFIVTIGILVTIHEYGHFWVARRCGVKVLRFSIGFGKPLYSWYDRQGTEYAIAAIPLGGYVKMLDEREGEVPEALLPQAFNRKPVSQRIAIVAAGPLVNLVFAVFAYWLMFVSGISAVAPVVGQVDPQSLAAQAGMQSEEEIVAIDNKPVQTWEDVSLGLAARIGEKGEILLRTETLDAGMPRQYRINIDQWQFDEQRGPLASLGLQPYRPAIAANIGQVVPEGRAEAAGLQVGDRVVAVNEQPVSDWGELVQIIQANPEQPLTFTLEREGSARDVRITPAARNADDGTRQGYIGAGVEAVEWPAEMRREISYGMLGAIPAAIDKSLQMMGLTLDAIGKMLQGAISVKNLSGPITIAKVAGASAESGLESFLNFLAYLSISLGILNLLPIPMLDGGHLMFYFAEAIRGRPVSESVQVIGLKIGMAVLMTLMLLAVYNDLARL